MFTVSQLVCSTCAFFKSFILCRTETVQLVKDIINKLKVLVFLSIMSCYVIVHNRLSLSMGSQDVAAGANPSLVSG